MKVEGRIFLFLFGFLAIATVVYGILAREWAGTTALALSSGLAFLIGFYVLFTGRRIDERPEDNPEGEVADGAGELGFFSPHSWWPLALASSASIVVLGLVFAWWIVALGVACLGISIVGFVFEYYRGQEV
jgi:hypothetical protein